MRRICRILCSLLMLLLTLSPVASASPAPGDKVVFVSGGDLWWRYVDGGPVHRLTTGGGYAAPTWSPSGSWILAHKGEEARVIPVAGGRELTLPAPWPVWAPHEDALAFTEADGRIALVYPDHPQRSRTLLPPGDERRGAPVWSPDGRHLAYAVRRGKPPGPGYAAIWSAAVVDATTRELYAVRTPPPPCFFLRAWAETDQILLQASPGCSASVMADGLPLLAVPAGGGEPREVVKQMLAYPSFLALRGNRLAAVVGGGRSVWFGKQLEVIDLGTGKRSPVSGPDQIALSPDWAPDGRRLAYTGAPAAHLAGGEEGREALYTRRIWVANADGTGRRQVTRGTGHRDEAPRWLSDGNQLLFVRVDRNGNRVLRTQSRVLADLGREEGWFGYYGWTDYSSLFDLWRARS